MSMLPLLRGRSLLQPSGRLSLRLEALEFDHLRPRADD